MSKHSLCTLWYFSKIFMFLSIWWCKHVNLYLSKCQLTFKNMIISNFCGEFCKLIVCLYWKNHIISQFDCAQVCKGKKGPAKFEKGRFFNGHTLSSNIGTNMSKNTETKQNILVLNDFHPNFYFPTNSYTGSCRPLNSVMCELTILSWDQLS